MASIDVGPVRPTRDRGHQPHALIAQHLKSLDWCARTSTGAQRGAALQQLDAAWRRLLQGCQSCAEASHKAAAVASCMLGQPLTPDDFHRARRLRAGAGMADPYPFAAASVYTMLDAWDAHDSTHAMEDAFASMRVASDAPVWGPWPPAPGSRLEP